MKAMVDVAILQILLAMAKTAEDKTEKEYDALNEVAEILTNE